MTEAYDIRRVPNAELELRRAKENLYGSGRDISSRVGHSILMKERDGLRFSKRFKNNIQSNWSKTLDKWSNLMNESICTEDLGRRIGELQFKAKAYQRSSKVFVLDLGYTDTRESTPKSSRPRSGKSRASSFDDERKFEQDTERPNSGARIEHDDVIHKLPNSDQSQTLVEAFQSGEHQSRTIDTTHVVNAGRVADNKSSGHRISKLSGKTKKIGGRSVHHPQLEMIKKRVAMSPYMTRPDEHYAPETIKLLEFTSLTPALNKDSNICLSQEKLENVEKTFETLLKYHRSHAIFKRKSTLPSPVTESMSHSHWHLDDSPVRAENSGQYDAEEEEESNVVHKLDNTHSSELVGAPSLSSSSNLRQSHGRKLDRSWLKTNISVGQFDDVSFACDYPQDKEYNGKLLPPEYQHQQQNIAAESSYLSPSSTLGERSVSPFKDLASLSPQSQTSFGFGFGFESQSGIERSLAELSEEEFVDCLADVFAKNRSPASNAAAATSATHSGTDSARIGVDRVGGIKDTSQPPKASHLAGKSYRRKTYSHNPSTCSVVAGPASISPDVAMRLQQLSVSKLGLSSPLYNAEGSISYAPDVTAKSSSAVGNKSSEPIQGYRPTTTGADQDQYEIYGHGEATQYRGVDDGVGINQSSHGFTHNQSPIYTHMSNSHMSYSRTGCSAVDFTPALPAEDESAAVTATDLLVSHPTPPLRLRAPSATRNGGISRKAHKSLPITTLRPVTASAVGGRPKSATFSEKIVGWQPDIAKKVSRRLLVDKITI